MKTSWGSRILHAGLLAMVGLVLCWPLTLPAGLVAVGFGTLAGSLLAEHGFDRRYRVGAIVGFGGAVALVATWLAGQLGSSVALADALSPTVAIRVVEAVRWMGLGFGAAMMLRGLAIRYRAALAIEGTLAVLAMAATVSAHRDGMIARPLEISDWFWRQGIDPVVAFVSVGLAGAVLFAGVLAYGRSTLRTLSHLLLVLLLGIFVASRMYAADPEIPRKNPVGAELDKKQDGKRDRQDQKGSGTGQPQKDNSDLPPPPGQKGRNKPSAIVVFYRDIRPASEVFYFRHAAFSQYNGFRLVEATLHGADPEARNDFPLQPRPVAGVHNEGVGRTEVAMDVALLSDHSRMFALIDPSFVEPKPNPEPARFRRAYHVVSKVLTDSVQDLLGTAPGEADWPDELWELYTELPKDERYHDLAGRLQAGLRFEYRDDPLALALTVKQYLEESTTYSFKRRYEGEDPTAAFLFSEEKLGYCVHLAHAAAYLLRALGVPTRVSAGYAVPAENLGSGSAVLIKDNDAHAWAEIYLEGVGWVPIEVTPQKTDVEPQAFQEQDLQQLLGEMARKEGRFERKGYEGPRLGPLLKTIAGYIPWVLLLLVGLAYGAKVWRLWSPGILPRRRVLRASYRAGLDRLSAVGWVRDVGEPPERFAGRVADQTPSFRLLTAAQVGAALGAKEPRRLANGRRPDDLAVDVAYEVRKNVPWWRYVLGVLNPISWMWSR